MTKFKAFIEQLKSDTKKRNAAVLGAVAIITVIAVAIAVPVFAKDKTSAKVIPSETVETVTEKETATDPTTTQVETTTAMTTVKSDKETELKEPEAAASAVTEKTAEKNSNSSYNSTTKEATTQSEPKTTKAPETTTEKPKETTTQRNVTPEEVQAQVNAYIQSKGIKLDSSMTKDNAGWTLTCWASQERLNNGKALSNCKEAVDETIRMCEEGNSPPISMYCYNGGEDFYIVYW